MALPIERWAKQAVLLERRGDFTPVADKRILAEVGELAALQRQTWLQRGRLLKDEPTALEGVYAGLNAFPPSADSANIVTPASTTTTALWTTSIHSPIAANALLFPSAFRIITSGTVTNTTTGLTMGWDPRIGAGSTAGSAIAGTTLGASGTPATTASITGAFWYVHGDITFRAGGAPGANTTCHGFFNYVGTQATAGGLAGPAVVGAGHNLLFGGTTASFDSSVAGGFSLGVAHTVNTYTYVVKQVHFASWN